MLAAAPRAKTTPRSEAAAGMEMGSTVAVEPEKRSIMRPIVNGMDRLMLDETKRSATAIPIVLRSGFASSTRPVSRFVQSSAQRLAMGDRAAYA